MTAFLLRLIERSWQQQQQLGVKGLWKGKEEGREMSRCAWVLGSQANVADKNVTGRKGDDEEEPFIFRVILSNSCWWLGLGAELSSLWYRFLLSRAEEKWLPPATSERVPVQEAAGEERVAGWSYSCRLLNETGVVRNSVGNQSACLKGGAHSRAQRGFLQLVASVALLK